MSTSAFFLVIIAIGVLYMVFFKRMSNRREQRRKPGERNPIQDWLKGGDDEE
jgi:preprotein translocase subunit YajC